ncbi:MAG: hypothetical protein EOS08_34175 [Mesorhizobium sp.]|nr:MAG: hypothetical protein EOS08_34175 [Mesorhizobium sp.]
MPESTATNAVTYTTPWGTIPQAAHRHPSPMIGSLSNASGRVFLGHAGAMSSRPGLSRERPQLGGSIGGWNKN